MRSATDGVAPETSSTQPPAKIATAKRDGTHGARQRTVSAGSLASVRSNRPMRIVHPRRTMPPGSIGRATSARLLDGLAVMLQLAVQRLAIEAQDACGSRLVPARGLEHALDVAPLHFLERRQLAGIVGGDHDVRGAIAAHAFGQVLDGDLLERRERRGAL